MISKSFLRRIQKVIDAMNGIGLKVIDVSKYTTDYIGERASESVVVGYVPGYAAVFTIHTTASGGMIFRIDGQVRDDGRFAPTTAHRFGKIQRPVNAGELFGKFDFGINIYMPSTEKGDLLQKGTDFFEKFIELYIKFLESRFTEKVMLHVAVTYSDEYKEFEALYGAMSGAAQDHFEQRIRNKFPCGFFPK